MQDIKTFFTMIKQIFRLLSHRQIRNAVFVLAVVIIAALFETLGVAAVLPFVQALTDPEQLMNQRMIAWGVGLLHIESTNQLVLLTGIGIIIIYFIKNAFILFSSYVKNRFATSLSKELAIQVMDSFMHRPYSYFVRHNSSEILRGVGGDIGSVNGSLTNLMMILSEGMVVIVIGIYLFMEDAAMAIGVLAVGIVVAIFIVVILKKKMSQMGELSRAADGESNKITVQIAQGIKDIYVMQKRESFMQRFIASREKSRRATLAYQFAGTIPERFIETFCIGGIISVVLIRFSAGIDMDTFVASLAVFAMAAFRVLPSISRISGYLSGMIYFRPGLAAACNNITEAKEYMQRLEGSYEKKDGNGEKMDFLDSLSVNHISWRYGDTQDNVLEDLSLTVHKGEAIGIMGESGAGKSTLSDILLGLYVPQKGSVMVDGKSIYSMPKTWSRMMGYVPQSVYLIDDTVRSNVTFGDADADDEKVWEALDKASLKAFIEGLPDGLDTIVGERGVRFSGGQRQRIAIARALYREPQILILDEATSALDNETESTVMEAIETLQGTMTMVIIAHRLTTIRNCDRIFEIKNGKAVERNKEEVFQ